MLDPLYRPGMERLIDDYLAQNPTRNRALDLLPAMAYADPARVLARVGRPDLVKPRPAYHYRLPNSLVGDPVWTIAAEWNRWVQVERLAADGPRLAGMTEAWFAQMNRPLGSWSDAWAQESERWLG